MITHAIGQIFFVTNFAGPSRREAREREKEREAASECKVALFFVLAVAGREIVLHARIASKRRRLHRGKGEKKK